MRYMEAGLKWVLRRPAGLLDGDRTGRCGAGLPCMFTTAGRSERAPSLPSGSARPPRCPSGLMPGLRMAAGLPRMLQMASKLSGDLPNVVPS
eukprot:5767251-Prymnesium_polylepis.1